MNQNLLWSKVISIGVCSNLHSRVAKFILQYDCGALAYFSIFEQYLENKKQYCAEMVHFINPHIDEIHNMFGNNNSQVNISAIVDPSMSVCLFGVKKSNSIESVFLAQQSQPQIGEPFPTTNYEICECDLNVDKIARIDQREDHDVLRRPYNFCENTSAQCQADQHLYLIYGPEGYCIIQIQQLKDVVEKILVECHTSHLVKILGEFINRYGYVTTLCCLLDLHVNLSKEKDDVRLFLDWVRFFR